MSQKRRWGTAAIVAVMGIFVVASCSFGEDDSEFQFCASPSEGDIHCVPVSDAPGDAYNKAKAAGPEPIQMWVERPENLTLEKIVADPKFLKAWLENVQAMLEFVCVTQGYAESCYATLSGKLQDDLYWAQYLQEGVIERKSADPKKVLTQSLLDKVAIETDPLKAEITVDKQTMGDVKVLLDVATVDSGPYTTQYKALVENFGVYRGTESAETRLGKIAPQFRT